MDPNLTATLAGVEKANKDAYEKYEEAYNTAYLKQLQQGNIKYNYDNAPVVYENNYYVVKTGIYPGEEIKCYLVINKQFNVVEYAHSIWYFCKKWADNFQDVMSKPEEKEVEESELPDLFGPPT